MAYPGFQRGGCLRSGPKRKVGGGGGGGAVHFRSDIRKVGGGGGQFADSKSGEGGGGGGNQSASGPIPLIVWHTENICMYLPTYYLGVIHTRAQMNL